MFTTSKDAYEFKKCSWFQNKLQFENVHDFLKNMISKSIHGFERCLQNEKIKTRRKNEKEKKDEDK